MYTTTAKELCKVELFHSNKDPIELIIIIRSSINKSIVNSMTHQIELRKQQKTIIILIAHNICSSK